MKVIILGNNSALPAFGRHPTAQVVTVAGMLLLLDCGEGAQVQLQRYGLKWRNLNHIYISHLHGDHYFGLPGLINSMSLLGRTSSLFLYGPPNLMVILQAIFDAADTKLSYPIHFHALSDGVELITDNEYFTVTSFNVIHRIACHGFLVKGKTRGRKLLPDKCMEYEIPAAYYEKLKQGQDYERKDGLLVKNEWVTMDGPAPKTYAYCADTLFTDTFLPVIQGADTIYHECTYLEKDRDKATARYHSTASQAATIALMANAKQLLLGHFSSKYRDLEPFKEEAAVIFKNVHIAEEGKEFDV
jgi:ribonuclease Z